MKDVNRVVQEFVNDQLETKERLILEWLEANKNMINLTKLNFKYDYSNPLEDVTYIYEGDIPRHKIVIELILKID